MIYEFTVNTPGYDQYCKICLTPFQNTWTLVTIWWLSMAIIPIAMETRIAPAVSPIPLEDILESGAEFSFRLYEDVVFLSTFMALTISSIFSSSVLFEAVHWHWQSGSVNDNTYLLVYI